jgi:hypothetical protein
MRYTRIALLSVAATWLLPFATPAIAELGHPSGCLSCAPIEIPGPAPESDHEGAPVTEPLRPERHHWRPRRHVQEPTRVNQVMA